MGKQKKGVLVQRPRDKAGQPCEAPGCKRTECSRWLATGRCCTSIDCQAFFGVGKGKAVAAALEAEKRSAPAAKPAAQPAAKPWRAPLTPGESLLELPPWKYFDEFEHDSLIGVGKLVLTEPFVVMNVRLDEEDGALDHSFLVAGTFELDAAERDSEERVDTKEHTRWVSFGIVDNGGTGVHAAPAALDVMEQNGAHEQDVARLDAAFQRVCDEQWEAVESSSKPGQLWYRNELTRESTWEKPVQYRDPDVVCSSCL
jgi:hypothetical protein